MRPAATPEGVRAARLCVPVPRLTTGQARLAAVMLGGAPGTLARAGLAEAVPLLRNLWLPMLAGLVLAAAGYYAGQAIA